MSYISSYLYFWFSSNVHEMWWQTRIFVMFLSECDKDQLRSHKPKPISLPVYNKDESIELEYRNVCFWKTLFLRKSSSMWKWFLQAEFNCYSYFLKHIKMSYSTHINRYISCGLFTNMCSFRYEYYYAHSNNSIHWKVSKYNIEH